MTRKSICLRLVIFVLSIAGMTLPIQSALGVNSSAAQSQKKSVSASESRDAHYWFQKGALCSTYGNNQAAVAYFARAIILDPNYSGAYFSQGVSYGQLGDYGKAINRLDRAILMEPQNGLYYYGRGRVYLLSGEKAKAVQDFRRAAELGDEDAQAYLRSAK